MKSFEDLLATSTAHGLTASHIQEALVKANRAARSTRGQALAGADPELPMWPSPCVMELAVEELRSSVVAAFLSICQLEEDTRSPEDESSDFASDVHLPDVEKADGSAPEAAELLSEEVELEVRLQDTAPEPLPTRAEKVCLHSNGRDAKAQLACPNCRRPVELKLHLEVPKAELDSDTEATCAKRQAYCAILPDGDKLSFLKALVLGMSLLNAGCKKDRVLLFSPSVPRPYVEALFKVWKLRPLLAWPRLLNKRRLQTVQWEMLCLRPLELTDYSKVLVMKLGQVAMECLDSLFDLNCPAASFSHDGVHLPNLSLLLLEPNLTILHKMGKEIHEERAPVFPPRVFKNEWSLVDRGSEIQEHLLRFYGAFSSGRWSEIPEELAPTEVLNPGIALPAKALLLLGDQCGWDSLERALKEPSRIRDADGSYGLLCRLIRDAQERISDNHQPGILKVLSTVQKYQCSCGLYDVSGKVDPLSDKHRWLCRFCWEAELLDQDRNSMPPIKEDKELLQRRLGPFFMSGERQQWTSSQGWDSWDYEFRPHGVLLCRQEAEGVGYWERQRKRDSDEMYLVVHLREKRGEIRYVLSDKRRDEIVLAEKSRELIRPYGAEPVDPKSVDLWQLRPCVRRLYEGRSRSAPS